MAAQQNLTLQTEVRPLDPQPKHCSGCNEDRPRSEFHKRSGALDGLQAQCKTCKSDHSRVAYINTPRAVILAEQKAVRSAESRAYVMWYLKTHPCLDCGEDDWIVLEFDHVRGTKTANIGDLLRGHSVARVIAEIELCDVRCANCHRRVTSKRAGGWRTS